MRFHHLAALIAVLLMPASVVVGASPKEIDDAIQKLKTEIYDVQTNGNWDPSITIETHSGGYTALATYALLASGENPQDPRIQKAIAYLVNQKCRGTYVLSLRCQVWLSLPRPYPKEIQQVLEQDAQLLLSGVRSDLRKRSTPSAFYSYLPDSPPANWDLSNSQYGVLGIWACAQADLEIPQRYWQAVDSGWRAYQQRDGGWSYNANNVLGPTASMTAAGIATLFITQDYLHGMDGIGCRGNSFDPNIEAGINWMGQNFQSLYTLNMPFYALYGVERIGVASGRKYLGSIDWFKEGSDFIIKQIEHPPANAVDLGPDASPQMLADLKLEKVPDEAFQLLFLARGRAPVLMNKLQYDLNMHGDRSREANWNQRPRDAANITRWIARENEHYLNWQIVNFKTPIDELHDAPILYIAGNQAIDFTDEELAKLRQFVLEGGLIFANADCSNATFAKAFHRMCQKLFIDYEFRDLPADSPIYTHEQFPQAAWKNKPKVEALGNGSREWVIFCPTGDPARFWQTQTVGGHEECHQLMANVVNYMVNRGEDWSLLNRGETFLVRADPQIHPGKALGVARLQYGGNWNPEPAGWPRLAAILHNTQDIELRCIVVKLGDGTLNNSFKIAHLTGTYAFTLSPQAREEIKKYLEGGGTLVIDACGGRGEFAESAQKELAAIFPGSALSDKPLALDDAAFALGPALEKVVYRSFARKTVGNLATPRIRAIMIHNRPAVFFSAEDLSSGMVGTPVDGIYGYDPATATTLMEKLVLYCAGDAPSNPQTRPATRAAW